MRRADARFSASIMISISIRLSFAGNAVDCMTNTSSPRTFSRISTKISSSAKRRTFAWVSGISRYSAIALASGRFELPAINFMCATPQACYAGRALEAKGRG
jgi:hypothetical protein